MGWKMMLTCDDMSSTMRRVFAGWSRVLIFQCKTEQSLASFTNIAKARGLSKYQGELTIQAGRLGIQKSRI